MSTPISQIIQNNRLSIVDKVTETNKSTIDKSTVDYQTDRLRTKLSDPSLGAGLVALALAKLGEAEVNNISDYVLRKSTYPGRAFVKICSNAIRSRV